MVAPLLSKELSKRSLETTTSSLGLQAMVSKVNNGKTRDVRNNKKGKGKF